MTTATTPVRAGGSTGKIVFFALFLLATAFVTVAKNAKIFDPHSEIAQHFAPAKGFLAVHALFGFIAMLAAVFQFSNRLRARYLSVHRKIGYLYVLSVFISAPFSV